jgi:hypothetical protein
LGQASVIGGLLKLSRSEKLLQAGLIRPSDRIQDSHGLIVGGDNHRLAFAHKA